jgi:6-pyruvoyltetrahydropterin/6-carboxytetrahydropterin synthase
MNPPLIELSCQFTYEAAHWLPKVPADHQCHRMHGHSYQLTVTIRGPINDDDGMVYDFADIKYDVNKFVIDHLDHQQLNTIIDNPTVENQLVFIWQQLADHLPGLCELTLRETATNAATYKGTTA